MYTLTKKAKDELLNNRELRFAVALSMNVDDNSVKASLNRNTGRSIANHFEAMNILLDKTGWIMSDLRTETDKKTA
jgi:hypothetical protein